ncbi:MAG: transporter, transrane region, partial [Deltaproteobacteria bacterium]|nr:transporter, transrane region [Deltaproteobacteria bacterium]
MTPPADGFFLEDRAETRGIDWRLLRRLLRYVIPHRGILGCALAALALGTACQLAGPYIIKIVIDRHVTPGTLPGMAGWILLYLAALAGAMGFLYLQMYAVSVLGQRVILAIRKEMFSRVQRLPVAWFDRTPTGRLMTRLTSDVEALQELISSGLVTTVGDAAVLAGTAAILLWMDIRLALVVFSVLPFLALFVELLKKRIRTANRESRRKLARLNAFLQEHVTGAAVLKAFGQEGKSDRRFDALNADYLAENLRLTNCYSVFFPGVELLASFAVALLLWRGGEGLISGAITFGTLVAFLEYAQKFYNPIKDMSDKYNILQSALASSERIFQVLD